MDSDGFEPKKHVAFLKKMLGVLPHQYSSQDSNRVTLLYFIVAALDLFNELENINKQEIIDFIYSNQVLPDKDNPEKNWQNVGFRGGPFYGNSFNPNCEPQNLEEHDQGHIAMTYTALMILRMLGDDYSKVNKGAICKALKALQQPNGSFCTVPGSESDMRFVYCACVISFVLNDWSGVDKEKLVEYILSSQSYDYGIGQGPGLESHGGSTYCGIAALSLMDKLDFLPGKENLIKWCCDRQSTGFQGRINKPPDTCYSFWIGATLKILGHHNLLDYQLIKGFTLSCTPPIGGFSKIPGVHPDVLHTYMGLAGLSLMDEYELLEIDPRLNITKRAAKELFWKQ